MRAVFLLCAMAFVAGCTTNWTHPYKHEMGFYEDSAQCEAMAGNGDPFSQSYNMVSAGTTAGNRNRIFEYCMRGKGWSPDR
jgi:hypothetical protein